MVAVLDLAAEVHRASDGGFDPTVLPLLSLIESSFSRNGHPPSEDRLRQIAATVDFQGVRYDRTSVNLGRKDRRISLDGVAKGFIVDRAGKVLKEAGVSNALINAGGDILALGRREGGRPWRIGIQDPFESGRHLKVVNLTDQAVATSGSYEIFFDKKRDYHHLLNPKDAKPSVSLVSATTLASSAAQADALATAAFVRPDVLEATETDGLIVTPSGRQISTAGFRRAVAS
jgi:thiamine biosynthesis lipoprotein